MELEFKYKSSDNNSENSITSKPHYVKFNFEGKVDSEMLKQLKVIFDSLTVNINS